MQCETCKKDYPLTQLTFIEAGRVPGLIMERRKATCKQCMMRREPEQEVATDKAPF